MSFRACQYQQSIIIILQILFADYHQKKNSIITNLSCPHFLRWGYQFHIKLLFPRNQQNNSH